MKSSGEFRQLRVLARRSGHPTPGKVDRNLVIEDTLIFQNPYRASLWDGEENFKAKILLKTTYLQRWNKKFFF